jgi:hypothetical protein
MADAIVQWRTPTGIRFTSVTDSLSVDVEATTGDAEGGIAKVVFTVNGGDIEVLTEEWRQPNFNTMPSPLTGSTLMSKIPSFGTTIDGSAYPGGDLTITAAVHSVLGTITALPGNIIIHNDSDGVDRRPCTNVIYLNADTGNDANDGLTPATAKETIQHGVDSVANGLELGGGELILTPSTALYEWASGRYGVPVLTMTDDWPLVIRVQAGAKITRPGAINPSDGGVIYTAPGDHLTLTGANVLVKMILEDPVNRQIEVGDLKIYMSNAGPKGVFQIEGGSSGSPYHSASKRWSVKFVEDGTAGWDPSVSGATNWEVQYFCHERRGVQNGWRKAHLLMDCKVQDILAIALQTNTQGNPSPCNLEIAGLRYNSDIAGFIDSELGGNVAITVPVAGTLRIQQIADAPIFTILGGVVSTSISIDIAEQAEELIGSPVWEVRFDTGFHVNNQGSFPVSATGYSGGLPWFEVTNATATAETPVAPAKIWTHRPNNPADYVGAIHPDICQMLSDPAGAIISGVRVSDSSNTRGWSLSNGSPSTTRLAMRNCDDGGFVNDFDTEFFTDCVFEHCNMTGPWTWSHVSLVATRNTIRKCVMNSYTTPPYTGGNVLEDCHFLSSTPLGKNFSSGSWFAGLVNQSPWNLTPQATWHGGAKVDEVFYPYIISYSGQPTPTKGVWANVATGQWLAAGLEDSGVVSKRSTSPPAIAASKYGTKTDILKDRAFGLMSFTDSVFLGKTDG